MASVIMSTLPSSVFVAVTTSVFPPPTLFNAIKDTIHILPKAASRTVKSAEYIQGSGEVGSIMQIDFQNGTYTRETVDLVDNVHYQYKYHVTEGGRLGNTFKNISAEIKIEAIHHPGATPETSGPPGPASSVTLTGIYTPTDNCQVDPTELKALAGKALMLFKCVENYLKEQPDPTIQSSCCLPS